MKIARPLNRCCKHTACTVHCSHACIIVCARATQGTPGDRQEVGSVSVLWWLTSSSSLQECLYQLFCVHSGLNRHLLLINSQQKPLSLGDKAQGPSCRPHRHVGGLRAGAAWQCKQCPRLLVSITNTPVHTAKGVILSIE